MKGRWVLMGVVGVDSGQLLLTDPCYIDSEWEKEDFVDYRAYKHKDGTLLVYLKDFISYEDKISKYGKTINQMIENKDVEEMPVDKNHRYNFSYNACSQKDGEFKQLNYKMGHAGVGVVFSSGLGDGLYEVWGKIVNSKTFGERISEVKIKLI
jgi:hypothetical protein